MSTRKMRGPFGRRSIAFVVFAVVIAMAGLVYAHWWTSLSVDATINTGSVGIQWDAIFTNDDGVDDGDGEDGSWPEVWDERWYGDSSADPGSYDGYRYDKDVGACWAGGDSGHVWIDIQNGYPSYHCTAQTAIWNTGSVPVKALPSYFEVQKGWNECGYWYGYDEDGNWYFDMVEEGAIVLWDDTEQMDYVDVDESGGFTPGDVYVHWGCNFHGDGLDVETYDGGEFAWGYYDEFDNFHPEITGHMPVLFGCGTQIDPAFREDVQFNFHVEQEAEQNATYRFLRPPGLRQLERVCRLQLWARRRSAWRL